MWMRCKSKLNLKHFCGMIQLSSNIQPKYLQFLFAIRQHIQDYKWEPVFYCTGTPGAGDRKSIIIRKSKKYTIFLNFSQLNCQICLTDEQPYNMLWQISVRLRIERNFITKGSSSVILFSKVQDICL